LTWGTGLARALALELHSPFFFGIVGTGASGILAAVLAFLIATTVRRHMPAVGDVAFRMTPLLLPAIDILSGTFQPWRGPALLIGGLALTGYLMLRRTLSRRVGFVIAVLLPLAIYLPDLSPYVGRADTFEFQVVAPRLGIAHPSGYPLYILIGKLFSLLPFGTPAWRVNLSSAVCAALASGVLFLAISEWGMGNYELRITNGELRMANPQFLIPLLAALTLAFSPTLWSRAIEAEVYALNALLTALGVWLAVRRATGKVSSSRALLLFGLLTGVAMASHVTLGALAFLALPLLLTHPRPDMRTLVKAVALGCAGLALYAYIPLRWPAVNHGEVMSLAHFLRFVTNADSGGALRPLAFIHDPTRWPLVLRLLRIQVGWPGLALAAVGLIRLLRRQWPLAVGTLLAFSAWVWFNLSFYVADPDYSAFLIPAHVMLVFWMGGANGEWRITNNEWRITNGESLITAFFVLLALSRLWITGPTLDTRSIGHSDEAWARYVLRQPLAEGAAILADSEKFPPLYYLQQVEGLRPDLELIMRFDETQYREALTSRLAAGRRVYLARYLPGLDAYGVSAVGPLVEVAPPISPTLAPTPVARFGDALELNNFRVEPDPEGRAMHHLTLVWYARAAIGADLEVRLRLTDAGHPLWESAATRPVNGYTTTQAWQAGMVVTDYNALSWPTWIAPGEYSLEIGVFPRFGQTGLAVNGTDLMWYTLGTVTIDRRAPASLPRRSHAQFGDCWLTGMDFPEETHAGSVMNIDLSWQCSTTAPDTLEIHWVREGTVIQRAPLHNNGAFTWTPGIAQIVRYTVSAPQETGWYELALSRQPSAISDRPSAVSDQTTTGSHNLTQCGWLESRRAACVLGEVNVQPSNVGLANFGDRIVLLDAVLDANAAPAGGQVYVTLRWRSLRKLDRDYTVFVQAVGPDGQLYGQADSWPVQGTRPTSGWAAGEELSDPYGFYLKPNAPAGQYQVIVGWYLLADMSRLPVINESGQAIGDFYTVGTFEMP